MPGVLLALSTPGAWALHADIPNIDPSSRQKILLLFSHGDGGDEVETFSEAFGTVMGHAGLSVNDLFFEYLDIERNWDDDGYRTYLRKQLLEKYAKRDIALIVTDHQPALDFLLQEGGELFPALPVLAVQAVRPDGAGARNRRIVNHTPDLDIEGTLKLALKLLPSTRQVLFVTGSSNADRAIASAAAKTAAAWQGNLQFEASGDLPLDQLLQKAAHLPPHTIILFTQYNRDSRGRVTLSQEVEEMLAKTANAPVFGLHDSNLASGGIGGSVTIVRALGASVGRTALAIVQGRLPLTEPIATVSDPATPMFAWKEIERWQGDISGLPSNSVFIDRPPGIWAEHKGLIVGVTFVLLVQLLTIAALLVNRRRRMVAERQLAASEDRFRSRLEVALDDKRQYEEGLEFLLRMSQQADALTKKQLYARALEVAVKTTRSRVGRLRSLGEDPVAGLSYPPGDEANKAVTATPGSGGPPETGNSLAEHVDKYRLSMSIPDGDAADMLIEVGGKEGDYNDEDRRQLTLVANMLQKILLRRRIEAALYESEARFRFITDQSPGLIWVTDEYKQCTWFNRTWLDFTGRRREQDLGSGWTECVHADDLAGYRAVADRHFDAHLAFAAEARLRRHDGAYRWMLSLGQPRFDESGGFSGYVGTCLDITERKQAEQEREQFLTFFRLSRDMMCIIGADSRFKKVNPAFTAVLGYREDELLTRSFVDFVLPDDRQSTLDEVEEKFRDGGQLTFENRFQCRDGTIVRLSWVASADPDGCTLYATARDFTALRSAEEQLNKLWMAVEQTSQSIVITDTEARIEYVNRAFCETSGYSIQEVLGINPRVLQSGQTPAATYADLWATLQRGEIWQGEFSNRRKDGTIYVGSARISPVRQPDGRITHYLSIQEDITEHKRTTEAIRQSRALLQSVIDATPDWIYVKDREHRFMLVNKQCAHAFDLLPADMIGRCDTDFIPSKLSIGGQSHGVESLHDDDDAVFDGQSVHHASEKIFFESGEVRVFDSFKIPMYDSKQQIYGALCYRRDITEHFNKGLEQQALETQLRQAQKMELIGHLTGGIAHDFNNILAAVFGYAELMQMSPEIKSNAQLELYLQEILQAGIRAKELVSQLLTFSHRREAASEAINVAPIVKEVAKLLRSTMPTSIAIDCSLAENLPDVLISPVQLHQILMNLGVNARDAMAQTGFVEIRADRAFVDHPTACASCHQNFSGRYLMISVRDSGSGITPENLMRIFDPFFTTKEVGRGSGLGLSVLHGIVHSANGHIKVLSVPGDGAEFRIYLPPHSKGDGRPTVDNKPDDEKSAVRGHIMVVDDEASIMRFMTVLLENLGCRVTGLTSASEALAAFTADPYDIDLVLTDQTMPELSGIELARAMLARRADIPIVLSTGYSNAIDDDTARQIGIRRFLMKPVPAKVLADIVAEYLSVPAPGESAAR